MYIQQTENILNDIKHKLKNIPFFESNDFWYNRIDQNPSDIQVIFNGHFP
jgi:spore maturation protein CgeB